MYLISLPKGRGTYFTYYELISKQRERERERERGDHEARNECQKKTQGRGDEGRKARGGEIKGEMEEGKGKIGELKG